ncbi:MAG: hypothetical protein IPG94_22620 [Kineosporiaceae bacterium]|nr:hypothetical protein [Kineosporiaceae bacterium]
MSGVAAPAIEDHLIEALLPSLWPDVQISRGHPGRWVKPDVAWLGPTVCTSAGQVCMGPLRLQDEPYEITVLISCTRAGDHTAQADADAAAWALLSALRDNLRAATTPNLGGTCVRAKLASYSLERSDDAELLEKHGRNATITAVLEVLART